MDYAKHVFRTRKRRGNEGNLTFVSLVWSLRHPLPIKGKDFQKP